MSTYWIKSGSLNFSWALFQCRKSLIKFDLTSGTDILGSQITGIYNSTFNSPEFPRMMETKNEQAKTGNPRREWSRV